MANINSPSFIHPIFVQADYGSYFGSGIILHPEQGLSYSPYIIDYIASSFQSPSIYNSRFDIELTWMLTSFDQYPGIGVFYISLGNSITPFDFFRWILYFEGKVGEVNYIEFKADAVTSFGGIVYNGPSVYVDVPLKLRLQINVGSDKGTGACDVVFKLTCIPIIGMAPPNEYNVIEKTAFNYTPLLPNFWSLSIHGMRPNYGSINIFRSEFYTGCLINSNPIISGQSFGTPIVSQNLVPQSISPLGIESKEEFGLIYIGVMQYISPLSIPYPESEVDFGEPTIHNSSTPTSALPPPEASKIGDIRLEFDVEKQYGEFILADRDVDRDPGLETAILITLLTNKRADPEDKLPDDSGSRGGFWGDSIPVVPDYKMGTKLWLLRREKTESNVPAIAKEYLKDGFQWMLEDGIIESVNIEVERRRDINSTLGISLSFKKPEGTTIFYKFFYNWEYQILRRQ